MDNLLQAPNQDGYGRFKSHLMPIFYLLLWTLPLFLLHGPQQSLMAFDEVHYAGRAKLMVETQNWINPWLEPHHKTPGYYWLVAASFKLFGINETAARFPNAIAGVIATVLLYKIGEVLFGRRIGFVAALVLNLQFIWLQYCRLSAPDIPMVMLVLLGIWCLLQAESSGRKRALRLIAGISFGLGFIVRSYVSLLPIAALLPYLIIDNRRHKHLNDWALYLGYAIGCLPTVTWLVLEITQYQVSSFDMLFGFAAGMSSSNRHGGQWFYYLWNLTLNAFPWSLIAVAGAIVVWKQPQFRYKSLCLGYPLVLFLEITLIETRTPRYSLAMYPLMALLASVALDWLYRHYSSTRPSQKGQLAVRTSSYMVGGIGAILVIAAGLRPYLISEIPDLEEYLTFTATLAVISLGGFWASTAVIYHLRRRLKGPQPWLASLLVGPWLFFALLSSAGLIGDYNADLKAFVAREDISNVLRQHQVSFVWPEREYGNKRLFRFYTPLIGNDYDRFEQAVPDSYVWVSPEANLELTKGCTIVGTVRDWQLVYVDSTCNSPSQ